jgi:hypothetical protein
METTILIWLNQLYYSMKKEIVQINASFNQVHHLNLIRSAIDSGYILRAPDSGDVMKILSAYSN